MTWAFYQAGDRQLQKSVLFSLYSLKGILKK
jgi:hypothetical protein